MGGERKIALVTGANGYLASCAIHELLQAGYAVRGTVRSLHLADGLRASLQTWNEDGLLEIVHVPDITIPGAFDNAVQGVTAVVHIAAPISSTFTDPAPILATAVQSTTGILDSCVNFAGPQIKSFVIMSSVAAIIPKEPQSHPITESVWADYAEEECASLGKGVPSWLIYVASKTASEKAMWRFKNERRPPMSMTSINPGVVCGPPIVLPNDPNRLSESAKIVWDILHDQTVHPSFKEIWPYVDVWDVARLVVWAIVNPAQSNNERYLAVSAKASPLNIAEILFEGYPDRRHLIQRLWYGEGVSLKKATPERDAGFDTSKAVKATGKPWIPLDRMVLDAAKDFEVYL